MLSNPLIQEHLEQLDNKEASSLEYAIVQAIIYADIFDYPLTAKEIFFFLVSIETTYEQTEFLLDNYLVPNKVSKCGIYYTLLGRESIVLTRIERSKIAKKLWLKAITYTTIICKLPFVRMVAVTGSLAVNNTDTNADIDLFIVTKVKRLWISRLSVVLVMKIAKLFGVDLCPNFLITEQALLLKDRTIYTAREFVQMVPLSGTDIYAKLCKINAWVKEFFPNSYKLRAVYKLKKDLYPHSQVQKLLEYFLYTRAFDKVEQWEMNRTSTKLTHLSNSRSENNFTIDCCKSHLDGYQKWTLKKYTQRLQKLN